MRYMTLQQRMATKAPRLERGEKRNRREKKFDVPKFTYFPPL
jgi:hypothetical protein